MNIIILGPQGSGKGTQAELLVKKYGFNYVEMGEILRSIADSNNPKAKEIGGKINSGKLAPDELVRLIAWDFINKHDKNKGFLFDGYPRSEAQYDHLVDMLEKFGKKIDLVIFLNISEKETIRRLSARLTCEKCDRTWNSITNPPPSPGECECGGKLMVREDDKPEAIKIRLDIFNENTTQILKTTKKEGILHEVNGEQSIEAIHEDIIKIIENK
jgi:adenylate kinase